MASEHRNSSGWQPVTLVALSVLVFGSIFLWPYFGRTRRPAGPSVEDSPASQAPADAGRAALIQAAAEAAQASVNGRWDLIVERARQAGAAGSDQLGIFVWTLFTAFDALEEDQQVGALRAFFETGRDARFGEMFTVGRGGWLLDWPTLRVALFDYVAQRRPDLARECAVQILQRRPDEPGEWALAFRELVRGQAADAWSSLLRIRLHEFIHDPAWSAEGPPGWMEGFDVLVARGSPEALADLAQISTEQASRPARFVAFLTADRLVLAHPAACLAALNRDPALFSAATGVRASLFARADVRDPAQRAELEAYFGRDDIGPGERAQFAASFPHLSGAPTHRLLTEPVVRAPEEIRAAEKETLARLAQWTEQARFPGWTGTLAEVRARLEARVDSGGADAASRKISPPDPGS